MFARNQFSIVFIVLLLGLSACSRDANSPATANTSAAPGASPAKVAPATSLNFVKASASEAQISAGGSGEAIVRVTVQSGYHVNANPPTYPYLKATELTVQAADGLSVGFVTYPTAITKKFSFAEKPLAVYEGEVPIKGHAESGRCQHQRFAHSCRQAERTSLRRSGLLSAGHS